MKLATALIAAGLSSIPAAAPAQDKTRPAMPDPEYCSRRDADPQKCLIQDGPPNPNIIIRKPPPPPPPPKKSKGESRKSEVKSDR
jgi:hypothetical protein